MDRGTFKIVPAQAIPDDANVFPARIVLTIKSDDDVKKVKAPFVIEGHRDSTKKFIVHQSERSKIFDPPSISFGSCTQVYCMEK